MEAQRFQAILPELHAYNAEVVGVSTDTHETQCEFVSSLGVNFPMVGDPGGDISRLYRAARSLVKLDKRVTYVIGPDLVIAAAFHHELAIGKHDEQVRAFLQERVGIPRVASGPGAGEA